MCIADDDPPSPGSSSWSWDRTARRQRYVVADIDPVDLQPACRLAVPGTDSSAWALGAGVRVMAKGAASRYPAQARAPRVRCSARVGVSIPDASASRVKERRVVVARVPPNNAAQRRVRLQRRPVDAPPPYRGTTPRRRTAATPSRRPLDEPRHSAAGASVKSSSGRVATPAAPDAETTAGSVNRPSATNGPLGPLRVRSLEVPDEQQPKIAARRQTRPFPSARGTTHTAPRRTDRNQPRPESGSTVQRTDTPTPVAGPPPTPTWTVGTRRRDSSPSTWSPA